MSQLTPAQITDDLILHICNKHAVGYTSLKPFITQFGDAELIASVREILAMTSAALPQQDGAQDKEGE